MIATIIVIIHVTVICKRTKWTYKGCVICIYNCIEFVTGKVNIIYIQEKMVSGPSIEPCRTHVEMGSVSDNTSPMCTN